VSGTSVGRRRHVARSRARTAGAVGNALEWYDFSVFGASAALVAGALTPGGDSALLTVFAAFGVALVVRPLGAVLGAAWADRAGRRAPLVASVLVMTAATAAIGLLPTYAAAGMSVVVAMMLLRVVQGLATGVEVVVSIAYLAEHAPPRHRGLWGGIHMATMAAGVAAGTTTVVVVSTVLPPTALADWGWRVPFLLALPLGFVAQAVRRRALETPVYSILRTETAGTRPRDQWIFLRGLRTTVAQGFVLAAALMASFNLWFVFLPAWLYAAGLQRLSVALGSALLGLVVMVVSAPLLGHASDRWGRGPVIMVGLAGVVTAWLVGYPGAVAGSLPLLVAGHVLTGAGLAGLVIQSTMADALPLRGRTAGLAASVGLASAIVGATAPVVAEALGRVGAELVSVYAMAWLLAAAVCVTPLTRRRPDPTDGRAPRLDGTEPGRLAESPGL
jgi:MHS family proline/betaine transporter-like MFS transporter